MSDSYQENINLEKFLYYLIITQVTLFSLKNTGGSANSMKETSRQRQHRTAKEFKIFADQNSSGRRCKVVSRGHLKIAKVLLNR